MAVSRGGGEAMGCAGHGVGTPSPFRPSLSPRGVAGAARWPGSAHALPTFGTRLVGGGRVGSADTRASGITGIAPSRLADSHHAFRRGAHGAWAPGAVSAVVPTRRVVHR